MVWEIKTDGISDCDGSSCLPPNACWWHSEYSKPAICAPAGLDLNNFTARISLDQSFAWFLAGSLIGLGMLGGILVLILVWLGVRFHHRRSPANNNENETAQQGQQQQNYIFHRLRQLSLRLRNSAPAATHHLPSAGHANPHISVPLNAMAGPSFHPIDLAERPEIARSFPASRRPGLGSVPI